MADTSCPSAFGVDAKGQYQFENTKASIYGKLGFAQLTMKMDPSTMGRSIGAQGGTKSSTGASLALGAAYEVMPKLNIGIEYNAVSAAIEGVTYTPSMFGLSATYAFS